MPYVFKITQRSPHTNLQGRQLRLVLAYQLEFDGKLVGIVTLGRKDTFLMPLDFVDAETWRSLTIPVEVPPMQVSTLIDMPHEDDCSYDLKPIQIISSSALQFPSGDFDYRVGEPIDVRVRIETSTAWSSDPDEEPVTMMYDVIADKEAWLVAGPKRGSYRADVSADSVLCAKARTRSADRKFARQPKQPFETKIILIPLRHGLLAYPTIVTQPLPHEIGSRTHQQGVPSFENYQQDAADAIQVFPDTTERTGVVHVLRELGRVRDSWGSEREVGVIVG